MDEQASTSGHADAATVAKLCEQLGELSEQLGESSQDEFAQFLLDVRAGLWSETAAELFAAAGRELGILEGAGGGLRLTPYGMLASDSLREHLYWRQRGRTLHFHDRIPALRPERLAGRRVLEIGCGACCNLLTLQPCAGTVLGIEIEPTYLTFGRALARLEGRPEPAAVIGSAEKPDLPDASWDVVLYMGALQYMDYARALREAARLLAPGGRVVIVQSSWTDWLRLSLPDLARPWKVRPALSRVRTLLGSLAYPVVGRALVRRGAHVYLTHRRMLRYLRSAGLEPVAADIVALGHETCYVAEKPAGPAHR